jgi:lysophospholipase L1-like esterase
MSHSNLKFILIILSLNFLGPTISIAQEVLPFQKEVESIVEHHKDNSWQKGGTVFTGSSSIRMWRELDNFFPNTHIINTGFGGSQAHNLQMHLDDLVLDFEPSKVFIYEGDNDVNAGKSTEEIISIFKEITAEIFRNLPNSQLYLISAKPSPSRWNLKDHYLDFNQALEAFADSDPRLTYIDVWTPMLDKEGNPMADLFIEDNLHMNEKGYLIWQSVFTHYVYPQIQDQEL